MAEPRIDANNGPGGPHSQHDRCRFRFRCRVQQIAEQIGVRAVEVDAIDEMARNFYLKFGFKPLLDDPHHLYLPTQIIRTLNLPQ
jgi:hypothetical protein